MGKNKMGGCNQRALDLLKVNKGDYEVPQGDEEDLVNELKRKYLYDYEEENKGKKSIFEVKNSQNSLRSRRENCSLFKVEESPKKRSFSSKSKKKSKTSKASKTSKFQKEKNSKNRDFKFYKTLRRKYR